MHQPIRPPDFETFLVELVDSHHGIICSWGDHGYVTRAVVTQVYGENLPIALLQSIYLQVATESDWLIESTDWLLAEDQGLAARAVRLVRRNT